ncbi:MAG: hypothetical protein ACOYXB_11220 [Bacteroidota bacterium]
MDISKTIGTPEQQILIERVGDKLAEISGYNKLAVKGFIRKNLETVLGTYSMKELANDPAQARMKVFMETAKKTGAELRIPENEVIAATIGVYEAWKKEFNKE